MGKLAREGRFDYLLIESTGISEPMPVAATFTFPLDEAQSVTLSDFAQLDTMVTVVDAGNWLHDYIESKSLQEKAMAVSENDYRTLNDLLTDQVEFANVILINKIDLAPYVGVDVSAMAAEARAVRDERPVLLTNCRAGLGIEAIVACLQHAVLFR